MPENPVLHVDPHFLVLEKPAGLLCVPGRGPDKQECLALQAVRLCPGALVVHRLDMATSGLVLMARDAATQRVLGHAFETRRVRKQYEAIVDGMLAMGDPWTTIDAPLAPDWPNRPRQRVAGSGKPSQTRWKVKRALPNQNATHLWLEPLTGRTHQLRVHLMSIGHPILGDLLYGDAETSVRAPRLMLHATVLEFEHPADGRTMRFESPAPFAGWGDQPLSARLPLTTSTGTAES